ncbi:MAG: transposase [Bacteroidetes bacterium]|nr:transposase [Bacteroidota bacterium]
MIEKNKLPNRKRTRLKEYDYSISAYYFVTICTQGKRKMFGNVVGTSMKLNQFGKIVKDCWLDLPNHYSKCELDYYVIMPDHVHGIIIINESRDESVTRPNKKNHGLSEIVRGFKSFSSKRINTLLNNENKFHWQRSFYDRIIRNEKELFAIRRYIEQNPLRWEIEKELPDNLEL